MEGGFMKSLPLVALLISLSSVGATELNESEIKKSINSINIEQVARNNAYFEILGINPEFNLISDSNPLLDNITGAQLVFRPKWPQIEQPGLVSIYAGKNTPLKRVIQVVSESIGYEVDYSKVSVDTLESPISISASAIDIVDLLSEIEDQTTIDVVLYPKNAGRYILMIE
jgi:hypothetical protein